MGMDELMEVLAKMLVSSDVFLLWIAMSCNPAQATLRVDGASIWPALELLNATMQLGFPHLWSFPRISDHLGCPDLVWSIGVARSLDMVQPLQVLCHGSFLTLCGFESLVEQKAKAKYVVERWRAGMRLQNYNFDAMARKWKGKCVKHHKREKELIVVSSGKYLVQRKASA
ncbi:hypothetical protein SELMODRAFT_421958 [Selaginella moellendorffii]|uniref:Uncharacterized protein n=1 Tax=Selaginella moellendorffii TaxID=88036 RepID=D8SGW8_SELML|nr:hypothetical protein SELMODRAFT_421958 [Selaginella moellendorffii]